jgi:hypothetical protein
MWDRDIHVPPETLRLENAIANMEIRCMLVLVAFIIDKTFAQVSLGSSKWLRMTHADSPTECDV